MLEPSHDTQNSNPKQNRNCNQAVEMSSENKAQAPPQSRNHSNPHPVVKNKETLSPQTKSAFVIDV